MLLLLKFLKFIREEILQKLVKLNGEIIILQYCFYLSFWQFRYFLVDGAVSVSKERSLVSKRARFFCPII